MTDPTIRERLRELAETFEGLAAGYGYAVGQTNGRTASAWSLGRAQIKTLGAELDTLERRAIAAEGALRNVIEEYDGSGDGFHHAISEARAALEASRGSA